MDLTLNDVAIMLGTVARVREARLTYYRERARVLAETLGETHPTTLYALLTLHNTVRLSNDPQ